MMKYLRRIYGLGRGMSKSEERKIIVKKSLIAFICSITPPLIIILPFWLIETVMKYNITASEWLGFYGSYIGVLIGTLSVLITIYFTNKEAKADRFHSDTQFTEQLRSSKMPYIRFSDYSTEKPIYKIDLMDTFNHMDFSKYNELSSQVFLLFLKNIGDGHATDFRIDSITFEAGSKVNINFDYPYPILKDIFSKEENLYIKFYLPKEVTALKDLVVKIRVIYSDLHRYNYYQDVSIEIPSFHYGDEDLYVFKFKDMKIKQTHPSDDIFGK